MRIALRAFASRSEHVARANGLTAERYELLLLIKTGPEGEATVGKLSRQLSIGQSAATQLVRRAEDIGLLERTLSPKDARVHPLRLTPEGERRLARTAAALRRDRSALGALIAGTAGPLDPA